MQQTNCNGSVYFPVKKMGARSKDFETEHPVQTSRLSRTIHWTLAVTH